MIHSLAFCGPDRHAHVRVEELTMTDDCPTSSLKCHLGKYANPHGRDNVTFCGRTKMTRRNIGDAKQRSHLKSVFFSFCLPSFTCFVFQGRHRCDSDPFFSQKLSVEILNNFRIVQNIHQNGFRNGSDEIQLKRSNFDL